MLTAKQQEQIEEFIPLAQCMARRWSRDDEFVSVAEFELCKIVQRWMPDGGMPLGRFVKVQLWQRLGTYARSLKRRREVFFDMDLLPLRQEDTILDLLPDRLRGIAELFFAEDYPVREISKMVCLPRREVREQLLEAKNLLRATRGMAPVEVLS